MRPTYNVMLLDENDNECIQTAVFFLLPQMRDLLKQGSSTKSSSSLTFLLQEIIKKTHFITLVIQEDYIDRTYRDCYYIHYSSKHFEQSRYCKRVFLFANNQEENIISWNYSELQKYFIGCFVIKPIYYGAIGRTLIDPQYLINSNSDIFVRTSKYNVLFHGGLLFVDAFPFSMQDWETLSCAEVTLLNMMDYYSNQYTDYKFTLPSDIYNIIAQSNHERILPSHGMSFKQISKVLSGLGFFPRLYTTNRLSDCTIKEILHYYIESGIPVALGIDKFEVDHHAIVCIGHGKIDKQLLYTNVIDIAEGQESKGFFIANTANACLEYVVMDDNDLPYNIYKFTNNSKKSLCSTASYQFNNAKLECLAVPLYKRMYLEAQDASSIIKETISGISDLIVEVYQQAFGSLEGFASIGTLINPLVIRIFLASSRTFRITRTKDFTPEDQINLVYHTTAFPRFIWVCEIYDKIHYDQKLAIGEIILDATSSAITLNSVIMINILNKVAACDFDRSSNHEKWNFEEEPVKKKYENAEEDNKDSFEVKGPLEFYPLTKWKPLRAYNANLGMPVT